MAAARQRAFVGRAAERELFRAALERRTPESIIYVHGPGGVGKSTLLVELADAAARTGVTCALLDGRRIDPSPAGFLEGLAAALLGLGRAEIEHRAAPATPPGPLRGTFAGANASARTTSGRVRPVLSDLALPVAILIDGYEALSALDIWMRAEFLPHVPAETVLVIAARTAPATGWRADAGLAGLCRIVPLRNLAPDESRRYLTLRGVPDRHHDEAIASTHGHPMALALLADLFTQQPQTASADLTRHPDAIRALVDRFLAGTPGPRHRAALHVCAHARVTTEALLADVLGGDDTRELFDWLRSLSFVEQNEEGLSPHDVARDVLETDLRWRNPDRFRALHRSIREHVLRRVHASRGMSQQRAAYDKVFIHRNSPLMKPYFDWAALGSVYIEVAEPDDHAAIVAMVCHHEGAASARIAEYWLARQPSAFQVYRSSSGPPLGFMTHLLLGPPAAADVEADPAIASIAAWLRRVGPVRDGERILVHRFWMAQDRYQDALTQSIIAGAAKLLWLSTPQLACAFPCTADPAHWTPMFAYVNFDRVPDADFVIGGRQYGVFVHDWRREPLVAWLDTLAERELDADLTVANLPRRPASPVLVLSEPDFARAVRQALRDYGDPSGLAANPLARSRMVIEHAESSTPAAVLRTLLCDAVETLEGRHRDEKLYRALWHTYLRPAPTQEAAAELLGLPFSTYRYHLTRGLERVTAWLWARELDTPGANRGQTGVRPRSARGQTPVRPPSDTSSTGS